MKSKHCNKCDTTKPISEFYKNKGKKDGLRYCCKSCWKAYTKGYEEDNPDYVERRRAYQRRLYHSKPEVYAENRKRWRAENPGRALELGRKWHANNIEKSRSQKRRAENRRRVRLAENGGSHTWEEWVALVQEFPICFCCGKPGDEHSLTEDHILPVSKNGTDFICNIQPLCKGCNSKKKDRLLNYSVVPGIAVPMRELS